MESNTNEVAFKDAELWKIAKKRAAFKYHLLIYIAANVFFWILWYLAPANDTLPAERAPFPWPLWPMFGWGIGILFNYIGVYKSANHLAEKEYQKLKFKQQ